jgi:hypothetical protein
MPAINKPSEFNIWAATGSAIAPTDEKYSDDTAIAHCNQYGFFEWDATTEYQANKSWTLGSNGSIYFCKVTHTNVNPVTDVAESNWRKVMDGNSVVTFPLVSAYVKNTFFPSADAATARTNLGITSTGGNVVTAASTTAARTALGSGVVGDQVFVAASGAIARAAIGVVDANDSTKGLVQRATDPEAISGVDDTKFLTPKKLKLGFSISLTTNGWIRLPSWIGSFQIVWGQFTSTSDDNQTFFFPLAFPNQCFGVGSLGQNAFKTTNQPWSANNITTTSFNANRDDSGVDGTEIFNYFAIGY